MIPYTMLSSHHSKSSTGFWRSRPSAAARAPSSDYSKVIGASYSYTDMLNFGNMYAWEAAVPGSS